MELRNTYNSYKEDLKVFDITMLPVSNHTIWVENSIFLDDNIDRYFEVTAQDLNPTAPLKVMMAMVLICVKGTIKTKINQSDNTLEKGNLLIVMPGAIFESIKPSPDCQAIICALDLSQYNNYNQLPYKSTMEISKIFISNDNPAIFRLNDEYLKLFLTLYRTQREILRLIAPEYLNESIYTFFQALSCMLASWVKDSKPSVPHTANRETEFFTKFINDVHMNAAKERSVTFYADRACLSPKYFARLITKISGHKPGHWIKNYVVLEAKAMLGTGRYSIQQVSDKLNFPNTSFFCKYFKSEVGMSPGQYIKNIND